MTAGQMQKILDSCGFSQRGAARDMGISERQMRRYCAGDAKVPKVVELALLHLQNVHEGLEFNRAVERNTKSGLRISK